MQIESITKEGAQSEILLLGAQFYCERNTSLCLNIARKIEQICSSKHSYYKTFKNYSDMEDDEVSKLLCMSGVSPMTPTRVQSLAPTQVSASLFTLRRLVTDSVASTLANSVTHNCTSIY